MPVDAGADPARRSRGASVEDTVLDRGSQVGYSVAYPPGPIPVTAATALSGIPRERGARTRSGARLRCVLRAA